ncbi:MAG: FAD-dependent oxidoreductase [Proteobacteria bacterium]|nr:MAG: FAD-dependent oxidoreductase [Pseudomonadota bacterium]
MDASSRLSHDAAVARDLALLGLPPDNWPAAVPGPDGTPVRDVLVVGAGMNGIAAAASLTFKGVRNIAVIDSAAPGREGPWLTYARMGTLRSPKTLPGPALGIPSLTYRAWHEARFGSASWEALYKIPNALWVEYLSWLQRVLALPVTHRLALERLEPAGRFLRATLAGEDGARIVFARRVVLATGRRGAGGDVWPAFVDRRLVPELAAHTNDDIDFAALRGKSIAIVGGGASAWDNAATALEQGAARVDMYVRRAVLPQVNKGRGSAYPGFMVGWDALPDAERWRIMVYLDDVQSPVPHETVHRTLAQAGFHIHLGAPVEAVARDSDGVAMRLEGDPELRRHDFLIVATGFAVEPRAIPELAAFADDIATWGDRYVSPPALRRDHLARYPYLGPGFELTERSPGRQPQLAHIHLVNHGAFLSHTAIASDIPGVNIAAERVSTAITQSLFCEDIDALAARLEAFDEPELEGTPFFVPEARR